MHTAWFVTLFIIEHTRMLCHTLAFYCFHICSAHTATGLLMPNYKTNNITVHVLACVHVITFITSCN